MEITDVSGLLRSIRKLVEHGAEPGSATVTQIGLYVRMLGGKIAALEQVAGHLSPAPAVNALSLPAPHIATAPAVIPGPASDSNDISLLLGPHVAAGPAAVPAPISDPPPLLAPLLAPSLTLSLVQSFVLLRLKK
ncbi:hypothetical protein FBU31_001446, partial [Coemansia sp. 'formosensis']